MTALDSSGSAVNGDRAACRSRIRGNKGKGAVGNHPWGDVGTPAQGHHPGGDGSPSALGPQLPLLLPPLGLRSTLLPRHLVSLLTELRPS